jgi:hypothetical protein
MWEGRWGFARRRIKDEREKTKDKGQEAKDKGHFFAL